MQINVNIDDAYELVTKIGGKFKEEKEEITKNLSDIQKHFNKVVFFAEHKEYDRAVAH